MRVQSTNTLCRFILLVSLLLSDASMVAQDVGAADARGDLMATQQGLYRAHGNKGVVTLSPPIYAPYKTNKNPSSEISGSTLAVAKDLIANSKGDSALLLLNDAMAIARGHADTATVARVELLRGSAYYNNASYKKAVQAWKSSLWLYDSQGDTVGYAKAASNLGAAYLELGYYRSAYDLFKESYYILPEDKRRSEPGQIALINMAVSQISIGIVQEAKHTLAYLLEVPATQHVKILCHINLAEVALLQNEPSTLQTHIEKAKQHLDDYQFYAPQIKRLDIESAIMKGQLEAASRQLQEAWSGIVKNGMGLGNILKLINDYEAQGGMPFLSDSTILALIDQSMGFRQEMTHAEWYALYQIGQRRQANAGNYQRAYVLAQATDSLHQALIDSQRQDLVYDFKEQQANILKSQTVQLLTKQLEYNKKLLGLAIGAIGALLLLIVGILRYHSKLKSAHRTLYAKNKQWSNTFSSIVQPAENTLRSITKVEQQEEQVDTERQIWMEFLRQFNEEKVYQNADLKFDDLVKACGTNKTYLHNAIKRFSGKTFGELVNLYRVEAAKHLLTTNSADTMSIVEAAGFNSKSSFYRVFKSVTGMTPGEFSSLSKEAT